MGAGMTRSNCTSPWRPWSSARSSFWMRWPTLRCDFRT